MTNDVDFDTRTRRTRVFDRMDQFRSWLIRRFRWAPFVIPIAVFLVLGLLEPTTPPASGHLASGHSAATMTHAKDSVPANRSELTLDRRPKEPLLTYPVAYTIKILATLLAVLFFAGEYRTGHFRISGLAVAAGTVGVVLWIVLAKLEIVPSILTALGMGDWAAAGARPAFDPLTAFGNNPWQFAGFLLIRFLGLALLVPLIEEFFLRGFLMRFIVQTDWWLVAFGKVTPLSAVGATVYGILAHPAEPLAAAVWFTGITALQARTRNIWDCVVAHAVTNLLLGIYVIMWHDWRFW